MATELLESASSSTQKKINSSSQFFFHRDRIEKELAKSISSFGKKTKLREACEYALTNGGKRFRPLIVLLVAEALGNGLDASFAALSVEFFHTASLIVDDLPCMDDEENRRGKPTLHKVYGETTAVLASYALITAGFEKIQQSAEILKQAESPFGLQADLAGMIALECAARCSGILGATGGQFLDLFPPDNSLETIIEVIEKKTVTLFETSFVFGWIFGGGDLEKIQPVKKLGHHFGLAFQIADDIDDLKEDEKKQKPINMARILGKERALTAFHEEMKHYFMILKELNIDTPSFVKMADILVKQAVHGAAG